MRRGIIVSVFVVVHLRGRSSRRRFPIVYPVLPDPAEFPFVESVELLGNVADKISLFGATTNDFITVAGLSLFARANSIAVSLLRGRVLGPSLEDLFLTLSETTRDRWPISAKFF